MCRIRGVRKVSNIVLCCVTLHNMQNTFRHGSYEYDDRLGAIAAQVPLGEENENVNNVDNDNGATGAQRQLQMIEYFNNW